MRYFRYLYFCAILLSLLVFYSCSDNSTSSVSGKTFKFMPLTVGNYWVYDSYSISSNLSKIPGTESTDSIAVNAYGNFYGKNSYQLIHFRNSQPIDTSYYYIDNNASLFTYMHYRDILSYDFNNWQICAGIYNGDFQHVYDTTDNICQVHAYNTTHTGKQTINANSYIEYKYPTGFTPEQTKNNVTINTIFDTQLSFEHGFGPDDSNKLPITVSVIRHWEKYEVYKDTKGIIFKREFINPTTYRASTPCPDFYPPDTMEPFTGRDYILVKSKIK